MIAVFLIFQLFSVIAISSLVSEKTTVLPLHKICTPGVVSDEAWEKLMLSDETMNNIYARPSWRWNVIDSVGSVG